MSSGVNAGSIAYFNLQAALIQQICEARRSGLPAAGIAIFDLSGAQILVNFIWQIANYRS